MPRRRYVWAVPSFDVSGDAHSFASELSPYREISDCDLTLDFSKTRFLSPTAVALVAALRADAALRDVRVDIHLQGCREVLRRYLDRVGFLGAGFTPDEDYAIPIQQFDELDQEAIGDYLLNRWLNKSPLSADISSRQYVASAVGELFVNVFNHASSPIGLVACGQYFPKLRDLKLTIVDFGVSIPETVRLRFLRNMGYFRPDAALDWAFKLGHSRLPESRGLGLAILKELIERNGGAMKVHSGAASGQIHANTFFVKRSSHFAGTLMDLTIRNVDVPPTPKVVF